MTDATKLAQTLKIIDALRRDLNKMRQTTAQPTEYVDRLNSAREALSTHRAEQQAGTAEMPEPDFTLRWDAPTAQYKVSRPNVAVADCYTADQLRTHANAREAQGYRRGLEAAAAVCHEKAERIRGGKKRVPQVDEHTALVLQGAGTAISVLKDTP